MTEQVRYAWRAIRQMPVVAAVVIVSLGAGIGVNVSVFSWIQAIVLDPIPGVHRGGRFHFVEPRSEGGGYPGTSWREYHDLREALRSVRDLVAFRVAAFNVGSAERTERTFGQLVSANYFSALALTPAAGRFFQPSEVSRPGSDPVVVISYDYWRTHFARRADVVGQDLRVNGRDLTVIGVAPPRFQGTVIGLAFDLWLPATLAPLLVPGSQELEDRTSRGYSVMGTLAPRSGQSQAQAELDATMRRLAEMYPESNATIQAEILPFWWAPRGPQRLLVEALTVLQAVLLLMLLAICGNTANLMLARASVRQREIAVRLALGAGRWRVAALLMTENVLLGLGGSLVGAAIALWGTEALRAMPLYGAFPIRFQTGVDLVTLGFAMVLGVACGVLFGLAPAIQLGRVDPQVAFRAGLAGASRNRLRNALMAVEVGLALIVLIAAGLFLKNFSDTRTIDPGFRRDGVVLAAYDLSSRNPDAAASRRFVVRLLDRLRDSPAIAVAAVASSVPLDLHGLPVREFTLEGRARSDNRADEALTNTVTPDYFKVLDIPFVSGTGFVSVEDTSAAPQAVVNEEFVRRFVAHGDAVGRRLDSRGRTYTISGVVRTTVYESFGETPQPIIYLSYRDRVLAAGEIHLRARPGGEPAAAASAAREAVRELDGTLPLYNIRTMPEHIEKNLFLRRIPARIFAVIGPLLLMLAAIGIYAVVWYAVAQRTTEVGIRLALGATAGRVVAQIVGESLKIVVVGAAAGWLIVFDVVHQMWPGTFDAPVFLGIPALLLAVAALACWIPARRAAGVDPALTLK